MNMNEQNRLWTSSYILNNVTCFIINVSYYMLMVIMTDYAVSELGASLSAAGFATGAFIIGALLARLLMGGQIERIGLQRSAYIGLAVFLCGLVANFFVNDIGWLSAVRVVQGIGFGIGSTTTGAIMARMVPVTRRGEGTSYYAMFVTLATAFGPYVGAALYNGSLKTDLIVSSVLLLACVICVRNISVPDLEDSLTDTAEHKHKGSWLMKFIEPKTMPVAIITLLVSLGFAGILGFVASFEKEAGLTESGQYFFIVYAIFTLLSRPFTGRLFDKLGANIVMYPAFVIFGIGLLLLSVASTGWELLLVAACMGIGFGTYMSCAQAIAIMVSPKNRMGVATSTFFIFMDLGVGLGPSLMGLFIPMTGFRGLFLALAILQLVSAGIYLITTGRKLKRPMQDTTPARLGTVPNATEGLVITISREYGSGGHEIGERIAARLGIPCYDQQIIEKIVSESNLTASIVSNEEQRVNPSELYRLYAWYAYSFPMNGEMSIPDRLFKLDCQIIHDLAGKGACIIVGRLAHKILQDRPHVINIFIHASKENETNRVSVRDNLSKEDAQKKVERINSERAAHCEYFTHTKWNDATNYDISIDSDLFGIEGTSERLTDMILSLQKS